MIVLGFWAAVHAGCTPPTADGGNTDGGRTPGASSGAPADDGTALSGCGIACDDAHPCAGRGMACLPAARGGTICKPSSCPSCGAGTFCAYDNTTCQPTGCSSGACGLTYTGACDGCVTSNCCQQNLACGDDPACVDMVSCAARCGSDGACVSACEQTNATAAAEMNAAFSCDQDRCSAECYDAAPGSQADAGTPADSGAGPVSCDFLSGCASVATTNSTVVCAEQGGVQVVLTNGCGQDIYCELGVQDPLPPPLGAPVSSPTPWTGTIKAGSFMAIQGCGGATMAFERCVPASQAVACLGAPAPVATTPPATTPSGRRCATSFVPPVDADCLASLDASCCAEETACANDSTCVSCSTNLAEAVACQSDAALQALTRCRNGLGLVCEGGA